MKQAKGGFWNLPNTITVVRILVVPVVMVLITVPERWAAWTAMILFIAASLSDIVDGYLARKLGLQSVLGAFLDPLADKLLVIGAMVMLVPTGRLPAWMVALFILRELTITSLRTIAISEGIVIAASKWGKYKTAYQDTALCFLLLHYPVFGMDAHTVGYVLMWLALFFTLFSGVHYFIGFARAVPD